MEKHYYGWDPKIAARKELNRAIFSETMDICKAGWYEAPSGKRVELPPMTDVMNASRFYVNAPDVTNLPTVGATDIRAVNDDCVYVTRDLVRQGLRPIMLNMANRHTPGGGVLNGARAQEESLFRQSNLCVSLYQYDDYHAGVMGLPRASESYPMDRNTGGIYSDRILFFREGARGDDALMEDPFECAVVSVAAINRPDLDTNGRLVPWAVEATEKKIRTMLRIGLLNGHDAIVLGAWGCGAFRNPPEHMAEIFHRVLEDPEFANKYKVVRFAVIEDHNSNNRNYKAFEEEFGRARTPAAQCDGMRIDGRARTPAVPCEGMRIDGRARTPAAPQSQHNESALNNDCGEPGVFALPIRKPLDHRGPLSIDVLDAIYFITIAAAERGTSPLTDNAATILDAARFYQMHGKWFLYLFLIMPDHIHMLVHVPTISVTATVGADVPGRPQSMPNGNALIDDCGAPRTSPPTARGLAKTIGDSSPILRSGMTSPFSAISSTRGFAMRRTLRRSGITFAITRPRRDGLRRRANGRIRLRLTAQAARNENIVERGLRGAEDVAPYHANPT